MTSVKTQLEDQEPVTWYLHITPECNFVYTANKQYDAAEVVEILNSLSQKHKKHLELNPESTDDPSALDIKFFNRAKITIKFGNTMSNWRFWKNDHPRYCNGKGQAISIDQSQLQGKGWFLDKDTKTTKRKVTFMYTGQDGTKTNPLKVKYDLCVMNSVEADGEIFETKIIIDPFGKDDGIWP